MSILDVCESYKQDTDEVIAWCEDLYQADFAEYFDTERALYERLKSTQRPISDAELEDILTNLPLRMFSVSEKLSQLRLRCEVVKIGIKDKAYMKEITSTSPTVSGRKEEATMSILYDQLLIYAYETLIMRVEKEISYSRELIMSAKKIWDSRRRTDSSNPVSESEVDLPEYVPEPKHQAYIKG